MARLAGCLGSPLHRVVDPDSCPTKSSQDQREYYASLHVEIFDKTVSAKAREVDECTSHVGNRRALIPSRNLS